MNAKDSYKIALNILAKTGMNGDLIGEFAKTMSTLHGLDSQTQLINMQNMAQKTSNQPLGGTIAPQPDQSTAQPPTMPPNDQNQPPVQNGGQSGKYDNL